MVFVTQLITTVTLELQLATLKPHPLGLGLAKDRVGEQVLPVLNHSQPVPIFTDHGVLALTELKLEQLLQLIHLVLVLQ
jgi:hypothetical protein